MTAKMGAPPKAQEEKLVPGSVRATRALWDLFHGVADARGVERAEAHREAMKAWVENAPGGELVVVRVDALKELRVTLQDIREMVEMMK